jgi:hypothetical protein
LYYISIGQCWSRVSQVTVRGNESWHKAVQTVNMDNAHMYNYGRLFQDYEQRADRNENYIDYDIHTLVSQM